MRIISVSVLATTLFVGACSTGPVNASGSSEASSVLSSASANVPKSRSNARPPSTSPTTPSASQTPLREPESVTLNRFYSYTEATMGQNLENNGYRDENNHLTQKAKNEILKAIPQSCVNSPATDMSRATYVRTYGAETVSDANIAVTKEQAKNAAGSFWDVCHLPSIEEKTQLIISEHRP